MNKTLILAAVAVLAFASAADAKSCKDAKGHFIKCPAVLAVDHKGTALAVNPKGDNLQVAPAGDWHPHCVKGKPCGHSCIAVSKVCHKSP